MDWIGLILLTSLTPAPDATLETPYLSVHIGKDAILSVKDKRNGKVWQTVVPVGTVHQMEGLSATQVRLSISGHQLRGDPLTVGATVTVKDDVLTITIDLQDRAQKVGPIQGGPGLVTGTSGTDILLTLYGNGIAVPADGKSFEGWHLHTYGSLDMPWVGVTDGESGYLLLWDGQSADDGLCVLPRDKKTGQLVPVPYHEPTFGQFGYPRTVRYFFVDQGGVVRLCQRYRQVVQEEGLLKTLREKAKEKPAVHLLAGAPNIWGAEAAGGPSFAKEAHSLGIRRMLINGIWAAEEMKAIQSLGYLNSRYDNYEDLYTCCKEHGEPYNIGTIDDTVLGRDGSRIVGWVTWDKKHTTHKRCSLLQQGVAEQYIRDQLTRHPHNAWFLDVTTATYLLECYDEKHRHDRTVDRQLKRQLAEFVGKQLGLVLGGEHGRWWGADIYDYWEGMMSHNPFFSWPAGHLIPPSKREEIDDRYLEWGLGHHRRVPLWEMVFHDCVVSYWYWGDSTDFLHRVAPDLTQKKEAFSILYGTPPMFWVNKLGFTWSDPKMRQRLLESYHITCLLHQAVGFEQLVHYQWITPDRSVQKTLFSCGTEVVVNFGETPYPLQRNDRTWTLPQYGFYVKGPRIFQYRILSHNQVVTFVQTPDDLVAYGPGTEYDFGPIATDGVVSLWKVSEGVWAFWAGAGTGTVALRPSAIWHNFDWTKVTITERLADESPGNPVQWQRREDRLIIPHPPEKGLIVWSKDKATGLATE
ncbi:MAG: glycoside hydrolase [Armatimonadetes bacterium]|nr:glycoside hydrolase [Armatimonadota bacterium]MDW8123024.1 glycoside hydrolase [Armatimonadota bacterium]